MLFLEFLGTFFGLICLIVYFNPIQDKKFSYFIDLMKFLVTSLIVLDICIYSSCFLLD